MDTGVVYATTPKPSAGLLTVGLVLLLLGGPALTGAGLVQAAWDGRGSNPSVLLLVAGLLLVVVGVAALATGVFRIAQSVDRIAGVGFASDGSWIARSTRAVALSSAPSDAPAPKAALQAE